MRVNVTPQAVCVTPDAILEDCQEHYVNVVADSVVDGWAGFLQLPPEQGPVFIVLDNFSDPVAEASQAVNSLGDRVKGLLVDTDASRRGDLVAILAQLAWQLRILGREDVKVCLTGGVTPELIYRTKQYVSSYGVGLGALGGPQFDFALRIVEVDHCPKAKIGVLPGKKAVFSCSKCGRRAIELLPSSVECCGMAMNSLLIEAHHWRHMGFGDVRKEIENTSR
jgi:nicotinic acid phosphoribosyltransferase